jgi:hypothetical protein
LRGGEDDSIRHPKGVLAAQLDGPARYLGRDVHDREVVQEADDRSFLVVGNAIQRAFQDIHVISQHIQSRRAHYEIIGRYRLGVSVLEERF